MTAAGCEACPDTDPRLATHAWPQPPLIHEPPFVLPPRDQWRLWSKAFRNLRQHPLPDLGPLTDALWDEYTAERVDLTPVLSAEDRRRGDAWVAGLPRPIVLLAAHGATSPWRKNMPHEMPRAIAGRLLERSPGTVIWLDWQRTVPHFRHPRARHCDYDWGCPTLRETIAIMQRSDLLIGIDSGPLHLARQLDLPHVGVWFHNHPANFALPHRRGRHVVCGKHLGEWWDVGAEALRTTQLDDYEADAGAAAGLAVADAALEALEEGRP